MLRVGNLSANVAYWLELYDESTGDNVPLNLLSLDGVVPARPVDPEGAKIPAVALTVKDLLLPASRAELYVRNDTEPLHAETKVLVLRTKGINAIKDKWPEIQLARIVLKPTATTSDIALGVNAPLAQAPSRVFTILNAIRSFGKTIRPEPAPPDGCVRDLKAGEHRRVTFLEADPSQAPAVEWTIATELVHAPNVTGAGPFDEDSFEADEKETVGTGTSTQGTLKGIPFEDYVNKDSSIDWLKKHVCIHLDHTRSHQQLWVLQNSTSALHNFHIHQMKFRLATRKELVDKYNIKPPERSHTCQEGCDTCEKCDWGMPDFKFYEEDPAAGDPESQPVWHDTYPVPRGPGVFLIMSYDAEEQVGRFVFHCHILKHEDKGLMAPIEVWE